MKEGVAKKVREESKEETEECTKAAEEKKHDANSVAEKEVEAPHTGVDAVAAANKMEVEG